MTSTNFYIDPERAAKLDVQGHRGARSVFPENTLPGFLYAMQIGVDTLELDLAVTKDNVLIVYHDQIINTKICRYLNGKPAPSGLIVHTLTLKQIKEFDCGALENSRFPNQKRIPGTKIPTLTEAFDLVTKSKLPKAKKIKFNIETKSEEASPAHQPLPDVFANLVIELVKKYGLESRVTIQSFDHRTLVAVNKMAPNIQLAALFEEKPKDFIQATLDAKASIVSPDFNLLNKDLVNKFHKNNIKVIPWTANNEVDWLHLIEMGVDGIITDDPEPLLKLLRR